MTLEVIYRLSLTILGLDLREPFIVQWYRFIGLECRASLIGCKKSQCVISPIPIFIAVCIFILDASRFYVKFHVNILLPKLQTGHLVSCFSKVLFSPEQLTPYHLISFSDPTVSLQTSLF